MSLQAVRTFSKVTFGLFALLGVGVVAAEGGCGPGDTRYYCDSTGCFNCDGYGCSPVKPPVNNTCTGNKSCGAGEVCTTTGCVKQCPGGKDTECPQGTVCKANLCVAPTDPPPDPKQCTTKADCNSGEQCQGGKCVACGGSNGPGSCAVNTDCDAGQVCSGGICKSSSTVGKYSSDGGAPLSDGRSLRRNWFSQSVRTSVLLNAQVGRRRRKELVDSFQRGDRRGALWPINTGLDRYPVVPPGAVDRSHLAQLGTRLWRLPRGSRSELIQWGYDAADAAVRSYST